MWRAFGVALLVAAVAAARVFGQAPIRDNRVLRSGVELTAITVTVRDAQGRLVTGLERGQFEVYEDGERQVITQFTNERVPVSVGVLLDTSDSMFGQRIKDARAAVEHFLFELLDKGDEYCALSFNHEPHVMIGWTSALEPVRSALDGLKPWGATAVYDAVLAAVPMIAKRSRERAAILIISDGADTASDASLRDVHASLSRSEAFVYAIAIDSPNRRPINAGVNPTTLREITDDSGGRTEVVQNSADIAGAAAHIAEELNHQYLLGYTSSHGADGKYHSIRVRLPGADYRIRARSGYVAVPVQRSY